MENGNLMTKCKPSLFCEDLKSPATDCIRAVEYNVGTDDVRMVLFPFNLCTPALKQEGGCDNGSFCAFNEKPAGETPCEPVPLCELTRPASFDESKIPTNPCFKICKYSSTVDEECVPLEILDGEHVISAYRRGSGPYAELLTDEETLQLDFAPTDAIKYPKCVKAEKLSEDQQKLVAVNRFLNCDLNPFYDAGNNLAMMLEPVDCKEGEDPKKFLCIPAATTTKEPASNSPTTPSTTTSMFFFGFFLGTIFGVMLMIGVVAIWHLFKKKPPRSSPDLTEAERQSDLPVERAESPVPPRRIHPVSSADVFFPKHRSSPKMQHGSKESAPASNRSPEHSIVDKPKQLVKSLMQAVSKKPSLDKSKELSKDRTRKLPRAKLGNRLDVLEEQERAFDDMPTGKETAKRKKKST
ncbi:unnamed protein product, partial [Mesorhabditis spiculigera]